MLPDKVKITFNKNNKRAMIITFKFPAHWHHGFHDVIALSLLLKAEVLLFKTKGQRSDVMKSKMAAHGKLKSDN